MMRAVTTYLRDCVRLLYWVFFKPTAMCAHINYLAPSYAERLLNAERTRWSEANVNLRELRENSTLRTFVWQAMFIAISAPFILYGVVGLTIRAFDGDFNWQRSWDDVALFVALGIALGIVLVVSFDVGNGVVVIVAASVALGAMFGIAAGATSGVAINVSLAVAIGVLVGMSGVAFGGALAGVLVIAFAVWTNINGGVVSGITLGIVVYILVIVGVTRLPFYFFETWWMLNDYPFDQHPPEQVLLRSPIYRDEFIFFPQPQLSFLLFRLLQQKLDVGLARAAFIATHPYQSWAAQKALKKLLAEERVPFFFLLDRMLTAPAPYQPLSFERNDLYCASFRYYTTLALLREIADIPLDSISHRLMHSLTFWLGLRMREESQYTTFARVYRELLFSYLRVGDDFFDGEKNEASDLVEIYKLDKVVNQLEAARELPYGEEFYQSLRLVEAGLQCGDLQRVAKLREESALMFALAEPLRPQIIMVFRHLRNAAIDAASFLTAAHELTRRDALLKAQGALEEARQLAAEVYEPERSLLLAVIEHWRRMFAIEGGRVAEQPEVETLPNPYVAGRPIRPEDGQLFAGRRDEMKQIEEKLQTGVGLVIYGQRRIGKSSILLHLPKHLPHDLLPVYLNLQRLMANTTGGFLHAVGKEIVKQLNPQSAIPNPQSAEFDREPYLSFDQLLDEIERRLQPGQRVLLSFDEFEELEQRVKAGKIEKEIFSYLRGVTQTGSRFALLFAGLHTLEQMTREYWNPFFQSVQTIRIGYLSELDARQLVTDPIEQFPLSYDEEAIDRIAALTNSHPYLTQSVCHNLINRLNDPLNRSNRATRADVDAVLDRTLETSGYYFDDYVWGWSDADERLALALIAEAGEAAAFAAVEKHLSREAALRATASLKQRDIISERTASGELIFRFRIPLSRLWVLRMQSSARLLLERTTRQ